ncbi:aldo-keto reductase family 1 member B1 [Strongylocentrotus purpuratus]|uniref:NADP-dependent oxidoreductase domain-containing protein n=1 Tax=Strongylocentrotus purpuratus TaxID=7668 RepID=A0A7M7RGG4_STRPU|nr:aldo-keto reductase family 1 member B1 [Strongylocentrotus purpuratus]
MASSNTHIVLPGGRKLPLLGFGTWQIKPEEVGRVIETAIDCGYRHIDEASLYGNEKGVGDGIKAKIDDGTIKREDLFVTSKLWVTDSHPSRVEPSCRQSLSDLGLAYLDLFLIHCPTSAVGGKGPFPMDDNGLFIGDDTIDYVDTWRIMESLVDKGLVRAIGVSNFTVAQIQRVLDLPPKYPIANVQVECHPFLAQNELIEFCKKQGITVTAYSPLGSPERVLQKRATTDPLLMEDPVVCAIAKKRGVSPALVLIRYQLQRGVAVLPKSVKPSRIQQNFEALNFELSKEEFQTLVNLNKNYRLLNFAPMKNMKYYPFNDNN